MRRIEILLLVILLVTALLYRFYNFEQRINFGPEQGMSLITASENLTEKISLRGQIYYRTTSFGHILFASPLFSYSLLPLIFIFDFDPVPITAYFALLNIITGLVIFMIARKMFNFQVAIFAAILFLFNVYMIYHSMFIWILNYLPLVGVLSLYLLFLYKKIPKTGYIFALGILSGVGVGLQFMYLFTALIIVGLILYWSKKQLTAVLVFLLGGILGNLPVVIFDLKHQFYHTKTLWQYFVDTLNTPGQNGIMYYHFFQFWPLLAIIGGFGLTFLYRKSKILTILLTAGYIMINLNSPLLSFTRAVGMNENFNVNNWKQAAQVIAKDNPQNFNIAALLDFDSRAYPLRYLVRFKHGLKPLGVEEYPQTKDLYVVAAKNYDFSQAFAWEITSFGPFETQVLTNLNNDYALYKLTKKHL